MVRIKRGWTEEEVNFLTASYAQNSSREIAKQIHRSPKGIRRKASRMRLRAVKRSLSFPKPIKTYSSSPDLAYLIGAIKGDGSVFRHISTKLKPSYFVVLLAIDFEFVSQVREAMGEVTGSFPKIATLHQHHTSIAAGNRIYRVTLSNKSLYTLLKNPLEQLRPYIEAHPADFLRGFFDAEGAAWININHQSVVKYSNTDKGLIEYVRELLIGLKLFPAPKLSVEDYVYINGEKKLRPKTLYSLLIYRKNSIKRFMSLIGSSIPRKRLVI